MRILILGGTRFIGLAATRALAAQGHEVAVFHRGQTRTELPEGVTEIFGDRGELERHAPELVTFRPDVLLDMLALTEADMQRAVAIFSSHISKLVVVSSCDVYRAYGVLIGQEEDYIQPTPLTEDSTLRPKLYPFRGEQPRAEDDPQRFMDDYEKILVERAALSVPNLRAVVLRLPMVFGPRDFRRRLMPYLKRMDDGRVAILLSATDAQRRFPRGYVGNVGAAIALAVTAESARGPYNVADEPALTELEWVTEIAQAAGWDGRILVMPGAAMPESMRHQPETTQDFDISSMRIRVELGFSEAVSLREAIAGTIEWDRANPAESDPEQFDYALEDELLAKSA